MNTKYLVTEDGCILEVQTNANSVEEFLKKATLRIDDIDTKFLLEGTWFSVYGLEFYETEKEMLEVYGIE